jgi:hypothetical protein
MGGAKTVTTNLPPTLAPDCPRCGAEQAYQKEHTDAAFPAVVTHWACGTVRYEWRDGMSRTDFGGKCDAREMGEG